MLYSASHTTLLEAEQARDNGIVSDPHWAYYDVWWYAGLVTLNFRGITDPQYQGTKLDENFGQLLTRVFDPNWRQKYATVAGGWYTESLRTVLRGLDAYNWVEIVAGISWEAYRGLDFYARVVSKGMPVRTEEAR